MWGFTRRSQKTTLRRATPVWPQQRFPKHKKASCPDESVHSRFKKGLKRSAHSSGPAASSILISKGSPVQEKEKHEKVTNEMLKHPGQAAITLNALERKAKRTKLEGFKESHAHTSRVQCPALAAEH